MSEIVMNKRERGKELIPQVKRHRPLDSKSVARHAEVFVIKGDTMAMKMGLSTFLTEKR